MANKHFRKNLNKGGGADSGRMGEIKSKLTVAGMKAKDVMGKSPKGLTKEQIEKLKELLKRQGNFMKPLRELKGPAKPLRRNLSKGGMSTKSDNKRDIRKTESMTGASKSSKREKGKFGPKGKMEKFKRIGLNKGGGADYMNTVKPRKRGNPPVLPKTKREKRMGGGSMMMQRPMMNKGGSLKPVDKEKNPGLAKLPTKVRNKMGYMKKGGKV